MNDGRILNDFKTGSAGLNTSRNFAPASRVNSKLNPPEELADRKSYNSVWACVEKTPMITSFANALYIPRGDHDAEACKLRSSVEVIVSRLMEIFGSAECLTDEIIHGMMCLSVFACLQPILIAGIALLNFESLPFPFSLTLYLMVMAFSPLIICAPKGRWWLLLMTLNQAVVYGIIVLMMHFSM